MKYLAAFLCDDALVNKDKTDDCWSRMANKFYAGRKCIVVRDLGI